MDKVRCNSKRQFLQISGQAAMTGFFLGTGLLSGCDTPRNTEGKVVLPAPATIKKVESKHIRTVRGPILPESLGFTSMHEHTLFRDMPSTIESLQIYDAETLIKAAVLADPPPVPENFFPEKGHPLTLKNRGYLQRHYAHADKVFALTEELMVDEITDFGKIGGNSILDCSVPYERGDPTIIQRISEQTGVNIIMSTGINSSSIIPKRFKSMNVSELANFFEKELNVGIDETNIVAGNIKLLVDGETASGEAEMKPEGSFMLGLEAASKAAMNTGAPITIHSYHLSQEEFTILLNAAQTFGAPLDRVIFSHFDTMIRELRFSEILRNPEAISLSLDKGRQAMDLGATLSFDLLGADWANPVGMADHDDTYALAAIAQYVKEGYGDRIVIGTDTWNRLSTRKYGGKGMPHLLNYIVPTLLQFGVSKEDITRITTSNPARLLTF